MVLPFSENAPEKCGPLRGNWRHFDTKSSLTGQAPKALAKYDVVVIATDYSTYDYPAIVRHARLVIDTRNATHAVQEHREKIVRC